jgi:4,5-DOPA dioxygenase extradiol
MSSTKELNSETMPVLFIGHGNPMNAVWDNPFTRSLAALGSSIAPKPKAILVVSAHWLTRGTFVNTTAKPEIIYDFGGFPDELYRVVYPAPGAPQYAKHTGQLVTESQEDALWGLDHGAWTILKHLYPNADIPVFELSIDYQQPMQYHFDLAKKLADLRERGVLIIGSGNIVHNLRYWFADNQKPYDWTVEFDEWVKEKINMRDFQSLVNYEKQGSAARLAVPTVDHYVPMLYSLALAKPGEEIRFTYEEIFTSASMRCFRIG